MKELPYCDFHLHSTRSDGSLSVEELLAEAGSHGIGCLCVSDHNIAIPEEELQELRRRFPAMNIFQGCEFSTNHSVGSRRDLEIHVIGLDFRLTPDITGFLESNRIPKPIQRQYINRMIQNLRRAGVPFRGDYDSLEAAYPQRFIGRAVVAREILRQGLLPGWTIADIFDRYIGDHPGPKLARTPKPAVYRSMGDCVRAILDAGGIPILAHPLSYGLEPGEVGRLMQDFASAGGIAAEVFYGRCSPEEQALVKRLADACTPPLRYSAASDFHSWESGTLDNQFPTEEILPPLLAARVNMKQEESIMNKLPDLGPMTDAMMTALENRDTDALQAALQALCETAGAAVDAAEQDPGISPDELERFRRKTAYICLLAGDSEAARRYQPGLADSGM